jgi:hypothetical protein
MSQLGTSGCGSRVTRKKVFYRDNEEVSAAGQGSGAADPGLRFARAQCPAGGASGRGIGPGEG